MFASVVVLKEISKPFSEDDERCFRATHAVKEYTHWNFDLDPSSNDKSQQARQWMQIANVVGSVLPLCLGGRRVCSGVDHNKLFNNVFLWNSKEKL